VFYNGVLFLLLSISGLRKLIIDSIPNHLKMAITCGIGLFIAFIGLKNGGVIVADPATFVKIGNFSQPGPILTLAGILLTAILIGRRVPGAMILSILVLSVVGLALPSGKPDGSTVTVAPQALISAPASLGPTFLKLDLGYLWSNFIQAFVLVLALLFTELFDNMGTLLGVCRRAGLLDAEGNLPRIGRALSADAGAAIISSLLGTSSTTSYIESAAGVEAGGRSGLTSLVVAFCFLLSLFFSPVILAVPAVATAPALVIVGVFMMQTAADLELPDFVKAVPAVLTILFMPLAFSISEGIAVGILVHVILSAGLGRWKQLSPLSLILAVLFLLHFIFRP